MKKSELVDGFMSLLALASFLFAYYCYVVIGKEEWSVVIATVALVLMAISNVVRGELERKGK